ncbi:small integral membrane protein 8 [Anabrus simplex]|uniref:small integral membrane protein 8 n=1 Tax=Anabrus simplex TaxID=316456 RepID=UPI0034DCE620
MRLLHMLLKENSSKETPSTMPGPGDGLRSLKTSGVFRAVNFELYVKPNKVVMGFGLVSITICIGYIAYMRSKYEGLGYYSAIDKDGEETFIAKKSKWDT